MKTVIPQEITIDERKIIKSFVEMLKVTYHFYQKPTVEEYPTFKSNIAPYLKLPFSEPLKRRIEKLDIEFSKIDNAIAEAPKVLESFSKDVAKLEALFKSGNFKQGASFAKVLHAKMEHLKTSQVKHQEVLKGGKNPFKIDDPFFFQTTDFIRSFSISDMEDIINTDFSKFKYSYLNFPKAKLENFQYLVYFIQELKDSTDPVELGSGKFNKWSDFFYMGHEDYGEIKKLVDSYLRSNNKTIIPKILELLDKLPELKAANEKLKKETKTVYRGVGGYSNEDEDAGSTPSRSDVEKEDKKRKFISCSSSRYVAEKFAKMIGHLESGRRSDWGYVITYRVNPDAIILDTDAFGGIFGEDEVLVDATKAKISDIYDLGPKSEYDE